MKMEAGIRAAAGYLVTRRKGAKGGKEEGLKGSSRVLTFSFT
jgi:hypothetical protein